jgi:hypothetical protein
MMIYFTFRFFILSNLGAGTAPEVLGVVGLLAEAEVCSSEAPAASLATFNNGSTTIEGTVSFVVASSLAVLSSAPCFHRLGSEASTLEKKKKEECSKASSRRNQERYLYWFGNTYLDGSSSSTEMTVVLPF